MENFSSCGRKNTQKLSQSEDSSQLDYFEALEEFNKEMRQGIDDLTVHCTNEFCNKLKLVNQRLSDQLSTVLAENDDLRNQVSAREQLITDLRCKYDELRKELSEMQLQLSVLANTAFTNKIMPIAASQTTASTNTGIDIGHLTCSCDLEASTPLLTSEYEDDSANERYMTAVEWERDLRQLSPTVSDNDPGCLQSLTSEAVAESSNGKHRTVDRFFVGESEFTVQCSFRGRYDPYVPKRFEEMLISWCNVLGPSITAKALASKIYRSLAPISSLYTVILGQTNFEYLLCCGDKDRVVEFTIGCKKTGSDIYRLVIFSWLSCQECSPRSCFVDGESKLADLAKLRRLGDRHLNSGAMRLADSVANLSRDVVASANGELRMNYCSHWFLFAGQDIDTVLLSQPQVVIKTVRHRPPNLYLLMCHR